MCGEFFGLLSIRGITAPATLVRLSRDKTARGKFEVS